MTVVRFAAMASRIGDEVGADDQHLGLRIVDDVLDLGCSETPVDVDAHRIEQRRAEEHLEVFDAVLVEEGDPILRRDADGGETLGDLGRASVKISPGETAGVLDERNVVGAIRAVHAQDAGNAGDVVPHDGEP